MPARCVRSCSSATDRKTLRITERITRLLCPSSEPGPRHPPQQIDLVCRRLLFPRSLRCGAVTLFSLNPERERGERGVAHSPLLRLLPPLRESTERRACRHRRHMWHTQTDRDRQTDRDGQGRGPAQSGAHTVTPRGRIPVAAAQALLYPLPRCFNPHVRRRGGGPGWRWLSPTSARWPPLPQHALCRVRGGAVSPHPPHVSRSVLPGETTR